MSTPETLLPLTEFAARIKAKHPIYKDVDDRTLAAKVAHKYPKYLDKVDFGSIEENEAAVGASKAQFDTAQANLQSNIDARSPLGRELNPKVVPRVQRPKLGPNEEGIVSLASDSDLQPQPKATTGPALQEPVVSAESLTRPRTVAPVSLEPVIQSRLDATKKQNRQRDVQRRVAQARAVREKSQGPFAGVTGGVSGYGSTIPDVNQILTQSREQSAPPRTFAEDRSQRVARQKQDRAAVSEIKRRAQTNPDAFGAEYKNFLSLNRTTKDTPAMRQQFLEWKVTLATQNRSAADAIAIEDAEQGRQQRVAQMGIGERAGQIPKSVVTGFTGAVGTSLKGIATLAKKLDLFGEYKGKETTDLGTYQLGEAITKGAKDMVGSNPDLEQEFFVGKAPETIGQVAQFMLGGWASKSPKLAVTILGSGMTAGDAYDEVRARGGSDEEAVNAGLLAGAILGPTELIGMRGAMKALQGTAREATMKAALKSAMKEGRRDIIENALQEFGQEFGQGIITKNPRSGSELLEAAALGGIGGTVTAPLTLAAKIPASKPMIDYAIQSPLTSESERAELTKLAESGEATQEQVKKILRGEAPDQKPQARAENLNKTQVPSQKPLQTALDQSLEERTAKPSAIIPENIPAPQPTKAEMEVIPQSSVAKDIPATVLPTEEVSSETTEVEAVPVKPDVQESASEQVEIPVQPAEVRTAEAVLREQPTASSPKVKFLEQKLEDMGAGEATFEGTPHVRQAAISDTHLSLALTLYDILAAKVAQTPREVIEAAGLEYRGQQPTMPRGTFGHQFQIGSDTLTIRGAVTPETVAAKLAEHAAKPKPPATPTEESRMEDAIRQIKANPKSEVSKEIADRLQHERFAVLYDGKWTLAPNGEAVASGSRVRPISEWEASDFTLRELAKEGITETVRRDAAAELERRAKPKALAVGVGAENKTLGEVGKELSTPPLLSREANAPLTRGETKPGEKHPVTGRKFSSTQVDLPSDAAALQKKAAAEIPSKELAEDGRESDAHITVKYGLHTENAADVQALLANEPPIRATIGKVSIFPAKEGADYDVVKMDVDSPDLHRLNAKIAAGTKVTDTHPEYKPHVTLAYVKPGEGAKYVGKATALTGKEVTLDKITFSGRGGQEVKIPLVGKPSTSDVLANPEPGTSARDQPKSSVRGETNAQTALAANAAQKLQLWGKRLKSIAETRHLVDLQSLSDEMAEHKDDPRVARLRTAIQAEIARARQPNIPESPKASNKITTEQAEPQKLSQKAAKLRAESERPEGKTVRPKPTHRIGAPKSNPAKNSLAEEVRAMGGIKPDGNGNNIGEIRHLKQSGKRGLVNETSGRLASDLALALRVQGYGLGVWDEGKGGTGINADAFLQAVIDDAGSPKHYSTQYDVIEKNPDVEAWDSLAESDYGKELLERVQSGHARASDIAELTRQAKEHGLSDDALDEFLRSVDDQVKETVHLQPESEEGYTLDEDGTLLDPDGNPLFARDFQLGLPSEGLTQQSAQPKTTSQRDALIRAEEEREEADPERAAALKTLAEIRRRGMTVDEYARQGALFGPQPSAAEIALLKELESPSKRKPETDQPSMFAQGEGEPGISFGVEANRVALGKEGAEILSDVYRARGLLSTTGKGIRGTFARDAEGLARSLDKLAAKGREGAKELASAVRRASRTGEGKVVLFYGEQARKHELFHEASDKANRYLSVRHGNLESLVSSPQYERIRGALVTMGYQASDPVLVEEAAAHIAEGKYAELGLTRAEAVDWMNLWFTSFAEKNPNVTPATFKELSNEAEEARNKVYAAHSRISDRESDQDVSSIQEGREGGDRANLAARADQTDTPEFRRWFAGSKVVDENGNPLVVYSGHGNLDLWGDRFDPKRGKMGGAGAFYATESTDIASNYAHTKLGGQGEAHENGDQYRFKLKNGKWGKKIWQIELTPEQQTKVREFMADEEGGGGSYDIEEYWRDNARYDKDSARALARGGFRDLQSIWQFMEHMGENIAYAEEDVTDAEGNRKPYFQRQNKSTFERLLDRLGIEWQSSDWSQPGVIPIYLRIRNPIDAEKPFPPDALAALKRAAKRTRTVAEDRRYDDKWTGDYPLRQWVQEIEEGYEYWSTQVPTKAIPILSGLGYDGIKEVGLKGEPDRAKRQINWIAFDPTQIKSAIGNRGTFDPADPNILMAIDDDPWSRLSDLAEEFDRIANEPDLPEGQKPLSLPKTLDAAQLESGPTKGYTPESLAEGVEYGKQTVLEKGIDGAMEFVRSGDGIEWASTGFEVSAQLRAEEARLRAEGKTEEADATQEKKLKFLDDFALAAVERGRSIVGIKAVAEFSPDRMAYTLNKVSLKKRKRGISPEEDARIAKLGEELGALEDRNKALEKALEVAKAQASQRAPKGTKPKKSNYQSKLDAQAEKILVTLKPKVGKFDFVGLKPTPVFTKQEGKVGLGGIHQLPGDAELIAQYAASRLFTTNTVSELNDHLLSEFGQEIEPFLPKIRQRAYGIRQEARLAEIEAQETEPKRRKSILAEIQKEIAESLTVIRDAQKAQDSALKAERRVQATEMRAEARIAARQAREQETEAKKQVIKEARADLKRLREEMKAASRAETKGYRDTISAQKEAARRAELWDTPLRNEAAEARERLKTATDVTDPQTMADLVSVAAEKFLPDEIGGQPRKAGVEPAKVYRDLKAEFPNLVTKKNQGKIYQRGYQRIQDMTAAAREAARMRSASAESKRLWDELGIDVDAQAVLIKQAEVRRQTDELRRKAVAEFNRVSRTLLERVWMEVQAFPRSLQSAVDAPLGRQGVFFLLTHPIIASKAAVPATLRGYGSIHVVDYVRHETDLTKHPKYDLALRAKLDLSQTSGSGDPSLVGEEQFQSPLAAKIFPHVRLSEQGYVLGMNAERLAIFDRLSDLGLADGYTPEANMDFFEAAARFVNVGTGRGDMPNFVKQASAVANFFFFSTRLNISRIQLLNDLFNPVKYVPDKYNLTRSIPGFGSYDPVMRKVMAQELLRLAAALTTVYMLAHALGVGLEFDPEDPDALLLRVRNTRYDITGGEAGTIRFLYRFLASIYKTANGEDLSPFEEPLAVAGKFLRYKLAPFPSGTIDAITGKDAVGNPANLTKFESPRQVIQENVIIKRSLPILTGNVIDSVAEEGWLGLPMALPALAGFGVSSYPDRGIRAIKNQRVVDTLEELKINSQSLIGQKTKDDDLDEAIQKRILERVENLKLPEGTEIGREALIREQLGNIRALAKAETALAEPERFKDYLVNRAGKESFSFLSDEDRAKLTEADVKKYRGLYADAYLTVLKNASKTDHFSTLSDENKVKLLDRAGRIAHNVAKGKMRQK